MVRVVGVATAGKKKDNRAAQTAEATRAMAMLAVVVAMLAVEMMEVLTVVFWVVEMMEVLTVVFCVVTTSGGAAVANRGRVVVKERCSPRLLYFESHCMCMHHDYHY